MSNPNQTPARGPRPLDADTIRKQVAADPEVKAMAEACGYDYQGYIEMIVEFAMNPDKKPEFLVVPDELLEKAGFEIPTIEQIGDFLQEHERQAAKNAASSTKYEKQPPSIPRPPPAQMQGNDKVDPKLQDEISKRIRGFGNKG